MARLAYTQAKAARVPLRPLLEGAGLTREEIEDPRVSIRAQDQIRLLNLTAAALGDDLLGFHLADFAEIREWGLIYYVLSSSETLGEFFQRCARYSGIVNEGVVIDALQGRNAGVRLQYAGVSRMLDRHQAEFYATAIVRMARTFTGTRLRPRVVRLVHFREHGGDRLERFFGCKVEFGAAVDEVLFSATVKALLIRQADPHLGRLMLGYAEEALAHRRRNLRTFRSLVENAIVPLLPHGAARASRVASCLGVSQRTLARRLSGEGVSFSDVLIALRRDLAQRYLLEEDLSIAEVAWLLGYQGVGAFSSAYKRWTGRSPREPATRAAKLRT